MTIHIVCVRDPDAPNSFSVFPCDAEDDIRIIDVDLGAADLADPDEFLDWAEHMFERLDEVSKESYGAANELLGVLCGAIDQFGHDKRWITVDHLRDATKAER